EELVVKARAWDGLDGVDLAATVTCASSYEWAHGTPGTFRAGGRRPRSLNVVVYDFGVKYSILRQLVDHGCRVTVVPAQTPAKAVLERSPDGVLLSNGPGDPAAVPYAIEAARQLLGRVPILGICLGHQILGQAIGARTYRLKFGHHGGNQPVRNILDGRVEISAHNHNFAVDALPPEAEVTHVNLNDGCCEGFRHRTLPVMAVQYHPEAAPGPHDAVGIFERWLSHDARSQQRAG
ncbi:MAG TPA: carbamoyl phosphate synthase small subunit, partial [Candidatus Xenobia bacterium]